MIFDKCKSCKHYKPYTVCLVKTKYFSSKKPNLEKTYRELCEVLGYVQDTTIKLDWCENYERKEERRTKNEFTD